MIHLWIVLLDDIQIGGLADVEFHDLHLIEHVDFLLGVEFTPDKGSTEDLVGPSHGHLLPIGIDLRRIRIQWLILCLFQILAIPTLGRLIDLPFKRLDLRHHLMEFQRIREEDVFAQDILEPTLDLRCNSCLDKVHAFDLRFERDVDVALSQHDGGSIPFLDFHQEQTTEHELILHGEFRTRSLIHVVAPSIEVQRVCNRTIERSCNHIDENHIVVHGLSTKRLSREDLRRHKVHKEIGVDDIGIGIHQEDGVPFVIVQPHNGIRCQILDIDVLRHHIHERGHLFLDARRWRIRIQKHFLGHKLVIVRYTLELLSPLGRDLFLCGFHLREFCQDGRE